MSESADPLQPLLARLGRDRTDQEAWTRLYDRMWGFVLAVVFRTLRGAAAEDIAQEVFVRVSLYCPFEKLQTGEAFRAYLWKMARNACYSWLRRQNGEVTTPADESLPDSAPDPASDLEQREIYDFVTEELTSEDQRILRLTDEGFKDYEIARILGLSTANLVAVRRHRARDVVRKFMKKNGLID